MQCFLCFYFCTFFKRMEQFQSWRWVFIECFGPSIHTVISCTSQHCRISWDGLHSLNIQIFIKLSIKRYRQSNQFSLVYLTCVNKYFKCPCFFYIIYSPTFTLMVLFLAVMVTSSLQTSYSKHFLIVHGLLLCSQKWGLWSQSS